jgi:nitrogen fixation/metabolism regulation signal transduction histidine kinase
MHPDSEGFGLGLAIVKTIVYNHGGNIKLAKSQLGGLRVIIKLPL